jgi:hypothetical protein
MIDDSGQMSIDFLIGFTIFIIGIIIVVTLMSGLLVGLQSKTIDLDAVAYRTGVILVEDPGQLNPENPYGYADEWELIDPAYKDDILRLGMALSKDYPNILTRAKVERFFDSSFFSYPDDYRRTLFFTGEGMYEYHFNIMLTDPNYLSIGEPVPTNQQYGYIKRAVFIKEPPYGAEFTCAGDPERVDINLDFSTLHNGDRGPIYWIDPLKEKIIIRLITDAGVDLENVYLSHVDENGIISPIPGQHYLPVTTSGDPAPPYPVTIPDDGSGAGPYVEIEFPQGYFEPFSASKFQLSFDFANAAGNPQSHDYDYPVPGLSSHLTPATLEVCVW